MAKSEGGSVTEILSRMLRLDSIRYMDVCEMRKLLELYTGRVVAEKKDDLDFEKLEQYLRGTIESKNVWDMRIGYNVQFHICIAEATGNPLLICFTKPMMSLWKTTLLRGIVEQQKDHRDGIEFHKRVIGGPKKGDPDKAEAIMRAHIEKSAEMCWMEDAQ